MRSNTFIAFSAVLAAIASPACAAPLPLNEYGTGGIDRGLCDGVRRDSYEAEKPMLKSFANGMVDAIVDNDDPENIQRWFEIANDVDEPHQYKALKNQAKLSGLAKGGKYGQSRKPNKDEGFLSADMEDAIQGALAAKAPTMTSKQKEGFFGKLWRVIGPDQDELKGLGAALGVGLAKAASNAVISLLTA